MKSILATSLAVAALCGAASFAPTALAADTAAPPTPAATPDAPEQFVVTGKAIRELKVLIERAEDDVYARFNDINSDDRFDIHCDSRLNLGSHIRGPRVCVSNAWRKADEEIGEATSRQLRGEAGPSPQVFRGEQLVDQADLNGEMRRLARADPEFGKDLVRLGQAYQALELVTGSGAQWTMDREIPAGEDGLPFAAERMVDVRIGNTPWTSRLTHRTFTLAAVSGRVRDMNLQCDHAGKKTKKLVFADDAEYTVPAAWGQCTLTVAAKRETTFRLVEFD